MEKDLKDLTLPQLEALTAALGQKNFIARYIFTFIHQKAASDIDHLTTLSKPFRAQLASQGYYISHLTTVEKFTDPDGTIKYLFELPDSNRVESVVLFDEKRTTLCLSTQAGCAMNCVFCATAKIKFKRNLSAAEIADQLYIVEKDGCKVTNLVYMGMGEPMQNYDNVIRSVAIINSSHGRNLGIRHITLSTCGIPDKIDALANEDLQPRLAVSLNAPIDSIRSQLMPVNEKYPIQTLLASVIKYQLKTGQRVTFEYVMLKDLNDSANHAQRLIKILKPIKCNVNLIEYNPHPACRLQPSPPEKIKNFAQILNDAGIETVIRFKRGRTIKAACGQLGATWLTPEI